MEVRATPAGPNHVRVELVFKTDGRLKDFGWVDLHFGRGDNPPLTAALREDRTKAGRVSVSVSADRARLDQISLWIMVPEPLGGTAYTLRVKDFVAPAKER